MGITLSCFYDEAKQTIEGVLEDHSCLVFGVYGSSHIRVADIRNYYIEKINEESEFANLLLTLNCLDKVITDTNDFELIEKEIKLHVLNSEGDYNWTPNMKLKVWNNDYPSSVAVDIETGKVYLFNLKRTKLELIYFGNLTESDLEDFLYNRSERAPYKIKIDPDAMFQVIDGVEGYRYLQRNIYIEFDCIVKLRVNPVKEGIL